MDAVSSLQSLYNLGFLEAFESLGIISLLIISCALGLALTPKLLIRPRCRGRYYRKQFVRNQCN